MRLNPVKCAFGVSSGKFLGHIVTKRGIETNPMQLQSNFGLGMPRSVREVQRLTGKIAALSRFISRMSDICEPFFKSIKKNTSSLWGPEQENAFYIIKTVSQFTSYFIFAAARRRFVYVSSSV